MKYYEMKLSDFELAWKEELQEAKEKYPNGDIGEIEYDTKDDKGKRIKKIETYYYDPIKYYNLLHKEYDETCSKMKEIITKGISVDDLPNLVKLEFKLAQIIFEYECEPLGWDCLAETDEYSFDDRLELDSGDYEYYFKNQDSRKLLVN